MSKLSIKGDTFVAKPIEVQVTSSFEDAFRRFKSLVQREGIIGLYKEKQQFEKPSMKKRRKKREAAERRFLQTMRDKMIENGEWAKRKKQKERKIADKIEKKIKKQEEFDLGFYNE